MTYCSIKPNKNIFTAFVGLIVSGYSLAENSCDSEIINSIGEIKCDEDIIEYFKQARTLTCKVNPYWPRAFLLSLSSLFITEESPCEYIDFIKLQSHIENLYQINPNEKTEELFSWLKKLPNYIGKLQNDARVQEIWLKYISLINKNKENYELISDQSFSLVKDALNISKDNLPKLTIIPNYLQAPQATDFATIEDRIYIIKAKPDKESIIHELLHQILDVRLGECRDLINENISLLKPNLDEMINYQYAWDYDVGSWNRVFEENFMRATSAWITFHHDMNNAREEAILHRNYGFIYVPIILEHFFSNWKGLKSFRSFVNDCLKSCRSYYENI